MNRLIWLVVPFVIIAIALSAEFLTAGKQVTGEGTVVAKGSHVRTLTYPMPYSSNALPAGEEGPTIPLSVVNDHYYLIIDYDGKRWEIDSDRDHYEDIKLKSKVPFVGRLTPVFHRFVDGKHIPREPQPQSF